MFASPSCMMRARNWITAEFPCLSLDLFRVLVGLLGAAYFLSLIWQIPELTGPDALYSQQLVRWALPETSLTFFQPSWPPWAFVAVWGGAAGLSIAMALGLRPRLMAALLFVVSVASFRWNFLVTYLDDYFIAILFFWMVLMPVGRTATLPQLVSRGRSAWSDWRRQTVPGTCVRLFLLNLCFLYVVAGVWKLTSEFWRDGFALFVMMRQAEWANEPSLLLTIASYGVLLFELSFPIWVLAPHGSKRKWVGALGSLGLHGGIIAITGVAVFANAALLAALVLFLAIDIPHASPASPPRASRTHTIAATVGAAYLIAAVLATPLPWIGVSVGPLQTALEHVTLHQHYRLFNWIDHRNFVFELELRATARDEAAVPPTAQLPRRGSLRRRVLESYLFDQDWHRLPRKRRAPIVADMRRRLERRFCDEHPDVVAAEIVVTMRRVRPGSPPTTPPAVRRWLQFDCE